MSDEPVTGTGAPIDPNKPPPKAPATDPKLETPAPPAPPTPWQLMVGRDLVALGFVVVVASIGLAIVFLAPDATAIATAVAPVLTLVGTLVGAVFGAQIGNQGKQAETQAKNDAQARAIEAVALLDPATGVELVNSWRNSSSRGNPTLEDF